ncbi:histidine phosphatase family protein [Candidatus Uhrbacteria bacterium]|nr:histidine phosphatase family protein [Candidatus Uhrbacteria bacterium]
MFALVRHAGYQHANGNITPEGTQAATFLAQQLHALNIPWREIRTSPSARTRETGNIIGKILELPIEVDERIGMVGNLIDLLPPTEQNNIIFISHLPVLTKLLSAWSRVFQQEEPPLTEIASGYVVDPINKQIRRI